MTPFMGVRISCSCWPGIPTLPSWPARPRERRVAAPHPQQQDHAQLKTTSQRALVCVFRPTSGSQPSPLRSLVPNHFNEIVEKVRPGPWFRSLAQPVGHSRRSGCCGEEAMQTKFAPGIGPDATCNLPACGIPKREWRSRRPPRQTCPAANVLDRIGAWPKLQPRLWQVLLSHLGGQSSVTPPRARPPHLDPARVLTIATSSKSIVRMAREVKTAAFRNWFTIAKGRLSLRQGAIRTLGTYTQSSFTSARRAASRSRSMAERTAALGIHELPRRRMLESHTVRSPGGGRAVMQANPAATAGSRPQYEHPLAPWPVPISRLPRVSPA